MKIELDQGKVRELGTSIMDSLTRQQVETLLGVLLSQENIVEDRLQDTLEPGVLFTLQNLLSAINPQEPVAADGENVKSTHKIRTPEKLLEEWEELWCTWNGIVDEVGDPDGYYARKQNSWTAPIFDSQLLAVDLEGVAHPMEELLYPLYPMLIKPQLFIDALERLENRIKKYPQWMSSGSSEPSYLKEATSRCILKWIWIGLKYGEKPGIKMLKSVRRLALQDHKMKLHPDAVKAFFARLPEPASRGLHDYFRTRQRGHWLWEVLEQEDSIWFEIRKLYNEKYK